MRPGKAASSRANCSTTDSGVWWPICTAPEPTRIRSVAPATRAMITGVLEPITPGLRWCSASQYRW